ncbi:MAG: S24 family peptidase, partial [Candidatus Saelkia tenebricola]|nr:S24 family peptidase [Candidatus Saelkia tenebricola]
IFNSVIVITDRVVLDRQLQDTIYQFEHKSGVVEKIDKDSQQLAQALKSGTNIIITTLQKFPFVLDEVAGLEKRNYAMIVDEAHSSQGGETAKKMKEALSSSNSSNVESEDTDEDDVEDEIRASMLARGKQPNLSFFAFTATPKPKTLEVFGEKDKNGKPRPFHLYAMRQAIEEGFILDVLQNYTTYKVYYQLSKHIEDDPEVNKKKAACAIARFLTLHPHNLAQKTEVMVEHFRQFVMKKIGGKAKAMIVTASREHVVRYKQEFDRYLEEKGYSDIKALVAFSGSVLLDGIPPEYRESGMNGFSEKELPEQFNTSEYQLLLVAEKYQTGYDQPLLHTMYVDKRLDGVKAVQALSRLNRIAPGKEDTFVLDFVNKREDILEAFQPYYELTTLESTADPNKLYDLKIKIESYRIIHNHDVDAFCNVFFKKSKMHNAHDHAKLNALVDCAGERFIDIEKEEVQEELANILTVFVRLYAFLAQVMPFSDIDLEKYYAYVRFLLKKLPKKKTGEKFNLGDDVALEYYRLQKIKEGVIPLEKGVDGELFPVSGAGDRGNKEEYAALSEIINLLNDRFGTDFTAADKLFFDQIEEELILDEKLSMQAQSNTIENFKYGFEDVFINKLIERMDQNQDIFNKIMDDKAFSSVVKDYLIKKVYKRLNAYEDENSIEAKEDADTLFFSDVISEASHKDGYLPVYSVEAVATSFGEEQAVDLLGWKKIKTGKKLHQDMFIAKVVGRSMEPTIKDGSYCLFRFEKGGSRNGLIVLVASSLVSDPETQQRFTIKRYHSEKEHSEDGTWKHKKIILSPDNKKFNNIVLDDVDSEDFKVVAEFVEAL